jgi:hypothetical protein
MAKHVFITTINSHVAEGSISVLYIFLTLDIKEMNDIRLIDDTDTNTPPTRVTSKRIFVELLGIREESVILYLWGMNPLA